MEFKRKRELEINIVHAKELAELGLLKEYAFFLYLKSKYRNSCIYNYSVNKVAQKFGLSRLAVKKHVNKLISLGWCKIENGHLHCIKLSKIDENKQKIIHVISITSSGGIRQILYTLRLKILQNVQNQFNTLKKLSFDLNHSQDIRTLKKAKTLLRRIGIQKSKLPSQEAQLQISMSKIAKMFKCSISMAHKIIESFKVAGDVLCIGGLRKFIAKTNNMKMVKTWVNWIPGSYYRNGCLYKTECNKYIFYGV